MTTLTILGHALLAAAPGDGGVTIPAPASPFASAPAATREADAEAERIADAASLARALGEPQGRYEPVYSEERYESTAASDFVRREDWYLRFNAGLVTTEDSDGPDEDIDFDEGYLLSLAFGRRMTAPESRLGFDLELEGVWTDQDADDDGALQAIEDVTSAGAYLNGVLDYRLARRISIYGGAGVGVAWMDVGTESDAFNDFDDEDGPFFTWQLKAGLDWNLTDRLALQTGYRFINTDDVEIDDDLGGADFDLETMQHIAEIGLRWGF